MAGSRETLLAERILQVVRSEFPDKASQITMDAVLQDVQIDSVDLITLLFRLEDEFNASIDFDLRTNPSTVGELIGVVAGFIPERGDEAAAVTQVAV